MTHKEKSRDFSPCVLIDIKYLVRAVTKVNPIRLSIKIHYMKKLFLTLIVAFATVCGFAQEKILDNI